jgi:hypothetical protein
MNANLTLLSESQILEHILNHIDNKTTDLDDTVRKEPVAARVRSLTPTIHELTDWSVNSGIYLGKLDF